MIGTTFSHYKTLKKLGGGGMVSLARASALRGSLGGPSSSTTSVTNTETSRELKRRVELACSDARALT